MTVKSTSKDLLQNFYTALYHSCLAPVTFSDINGNYKGVKGNEVKSAKAGFIPFILSGIFFVLKRRCLPCFRLIGLPILSTLIMHFMNSMACCPSGTWFQ